ncbi:(5-formylfuran-3-yl)methyl phosphate synthase [Methylophilus sp. 3sh_L]|uniref:(5-formylfuran-3-yl)methyl phosphate synthase n=1 Tax=Methylophilus sp. 3sh_L TaxID=3377114 RepID=UPI00398E39DB
MQVLVSVNSVSEAQLVLAAGVTLIDLKDTSHGALAALDSDQSAQIMHTVNAYSGKHPEAEIVVSATVGDTAESAQALIDLIQQRTAIGVDIIKLPEAMWDNPVFAEAITEVLSAGIRLVAVFKPDSLLHHAQLESRLNALAKQGYVGVMVDTIDKSSAVVDDVSHTQLKQFAQMAEQLQMMVGVAGGLRQEHLAALLTLEVGFIGFRSGLCEKGQRQSRLLADSVMAVVSHVSENCCIMSP